MRAALDFLKVVTLCACICMSDLVYWHYAQGEHFILAAILHLPFLYALGVFATSWLDSCRMSLITLRFHKGGQTIPVLVPIERLAEFSDLLEEMGNDVVKGKDYYKSKLLNAAE